MEYSRIVLCISTTCTTCATSGTNLTMTVTQLKIMKLHCRLKSRLILECRVMFTSLSKVEKSKQDNYMMFHPGMESTANLPNAYNTILVWEMSQKISQKMWKSKVQAFGSHGGYQVYNQAQKIYINKIRKMLWLTVHRVQLQRNESEFVIRYRN